jgi:hypothetical protein
VAVYSVRREAGLSWTGAACCNRLVVVSARMMSITRDSLGVDTQTARYLLVNRRQELGEDARVSS